MRLWEEASDNRRKWSNVVRKILIVCVISSQQPRMLDCWMTSQSQSSLLSKSVSTIHVCVSSPLHVTSAAPRPRLPWCWAPAKMSISQVVAGYFSRAGRGAAAAPGHLTITYHASSADLLPLSWSCSPHRSTVWSSHGIPDPHHVPPGPAPGAGCGLLLGPGGLLRQAAELARYLILVLSSATTK